MTDWLRVIGILLVTLALGLGIFAAGFWTLRDMGWDLTAALLMPSVAIAFNAVVLQVGMRWALRT